MGSALRWSSTLLSGTAAPDPALPCAAPRGHAAVGDAPNCLAQQLLVLVLLPAQPLAGRDVFRPARGGLEPLIDRRAQRLVATQPESEPDILQADVVPLQ